ncbi:hypothetical protein L1887_23552 [Cichorium endivia]|nr:hypothetical protein L1887_23552 [Cichorium endivia]
MKSEFMSVNLKSKFTGINQRIASMKYEIETFGVLENTLQTPFTSRLRAGSVSNHENRVVFTATPMAKSSDLTTDGRSTFEIQMDYLEIDKRGHVLVPDEQKIQIHVSVPDTC